MTRFVYDLLRVWTKQLSLGAVENALFSNARS
jgi:hypothetical protein